MARRTLLFLPLLLVGVTVPAAEPPLVPADTLPEKLDLEGTPLGLAPRPPSTDGNRAGVRVALGRKLFFDPILSSDRTLACASCHRPEHGFASPDALARGIGGKTGTRRTPGLFNRVYGTSFFWDGRAATLEEQALQPIDNPLELGATIPVALARLKEDAGYAARFAEAYDDGVTAANLGRALASFQRTLIRGDSPVDRFRVKGDHKALTSTELHGFWLYESKGQCWRCHSGPNFTDEGFHNTGVSANRKSPDPGRQAATGKDADRGRFKTPTLRGVGMVAPYMHDGSLKTLDDVVGFYDKGGGANPNLDPAIKPLNLTADERAALVAFLKSL